MEILKDQPSGSFMVRDSSSNPGCHAISLVAPDGEILHYLLVRDTQGYFISVRKTKIIIIVCTSVIIRAVAYTVQLKTFMVEKICEIHSIAFKCKIFIREIELIYMYTRVTPLQDKVLFGKLLSCTFTKVSSHESFHLYSTCSCSCSCFVCCTCIM